MNELKFLSIEEIAKIVYEFCKTNNITYIREDVLVRKITSGNANNSMQDLKENYNLDENGWGKDEEASNATLNSLVEVSVFTYSISTHFYEAISLLIEECKAYREELDDDDDFAYITFFLTENEVESIRLLRSTAEIFAKKIYDFCKTNNIECIKKEELSDIIKMEDDKILNIIINALVNKDMAKLVFENNNWYIIFYLTENDIQLNKNAKEMVGLFAKGICDYCKENDIESIEEKELCNKMDIESDGIFIEAKKYLKVHHLARLYIQDGKNYIEIYP